MEKKPARNPDMVLGSNREVTVRDVKPEACDLADFGLSSADGPVPVIEIPSGIGEWGICVTLRLQPPIGSSVVRARRGDAAAAATGP